MAESLNIISGTKEEQYQALLPQIKALLTGETDTVAGMANMAAALKAQFDWFWVGFYLVKDEEELVVGPFQGPVACMRIAKGKGVCGTSWVNKETLVVDDVNQFEGHVACNSLSQSEIVVPIIRNAKVKAVLDIDSDKKASFGSVDQTYLEQLVRLLPF